EITGCYGELRKIRQFCLVDKHQLLWLRIGKRLEQHSVHYAEDRCIDTQTKRQHEHYEDVDSNIAEKDASQGFHEGEIMSCGLARQLFSPRFVQAATNAG